MLLVHRVGNLLAQGGEGVGAGRRQTQRQRNSRPGVLRDSPARFTVALNFIKIDSYCLLHVTV